MPTAVERVVSGREPTREFGAIPAVEIELNLEGDPRLGVPAREMEVGAFGVAALEGAREMDGVEEREGNSDAARDIELYFGRSGIDGGTIDHPNSAVKMAVSEGSEGGGGGGFGVSEPMVRSEMLGGSVKDDTVDFKVLSCADVWKKSVLDCTTISAILHVPTDALFPHLGGRPAKPKHSLLAPAPL